MLHDDPLFVLEYTKKSCTDVLQALRLSPEQDLAILISV